MNKLIIFINNEPVYEYDRQISIDQTRLEFLDNMDRDMQRGFKIRGELIANPDSLQRATFVAMNLIKALQQDNEAIIFASCAYLANRLPGLVEVHANDGDGAVNIEFIEEQL